jgi:hypothetical protein
MVNPRESSSPRAGPRLTGPCAATAIINRDRALEYAGSQGWRTYGLERALQASRGPAHCCCGLPARSRSGARRGWSCSVVEPQRVQEGWNGNGHHSTQVRGLPGLEAVMVQTLLSHTVPSQAPGALDCAMSRAAAHMLSAEW